MENCPYILPGIYAEARREFDSFDPADITDEEGNPRIVVDVVDGTSSAGGNDLAAALDFLGGEDTGLEDEDDFAEALEEQGEKVADYLNQEMPQDLKDQGFSFFFEWNDNAFTLTFGKGDNEGGEAIDVEAEEVE